MPNITRCYRWGTVAAAAIAIMVLQPVACGWAAPCTAMGTFYVATTGDDGNPGSRERPFATLERARQAVRELKAASAPPRPVGVVVRGGRTIKGRWETDDGNIYYVDVPEARDGARSGAARGPSKPRLREEYRFTRASNAASAA